MLRLDGTLRSSRIAWIATARFSSPWRRDFHIVRPIRRRPDTRYLNIFKRHAGIKVERSGHLLSGTSVDYFFLRDSCQCSSCVNSSTRQKLFETAQIPLNLSVKDHRWTTDGALEIWWENDIPCFKNHHSCFTPEFLQRAQTIEKRVAASGNSWKHVAWDRRTLEQEAHALTFEYEDYMRHDGTLRDLIFRLHEFGLAFVKDVPSDQEAIRGLARKIGPLKQTFYGETWDVKSQASPINVAYTSADLDFHMDLLYLADPPGVQLLHCIKQSTSGGESRFSDGVRAFDKFQAEYPELVHALVEFPVTYRYKNDGYWFQKTRRLLEGGTLMQSESDHEPVNRYRYPQDYECLNWSPPFQGPLEQVDLTKETAMPIAMEAYIEAARTFKRLLADEEAVYETKLEAETCVIFHNRRVLHARRPFSSIGGNRWLKGCYVDGDYLRDKYRVLLNEMHDPQ